MAVLSLCVFVVALAFSFVLTRYVRNLANARGWVRPPDREHHLHTDPLPRLGGVAIYAAFIAGLVFTLFALHLRPDLDLGVGEQTLLTLIAAGTLVFLVGVQDDVRHLGPATKCVVQAVAGVILYAGGFRILRLPVLFGNHFLPWFVDLPLTILWVLAITNAFNLIDGVDGLAAGSALFSTVVVFIVALVNHANLVSLLTLALSGAILGFLRYNFNPATIFLGDSGSLFIGFMLSALALRGAQKAPTIFAVAIPIVSFGLPILETALSILRRWIGSKPLFSADQEHIHHKLLARGMSQRQVVIILYAVSAVFALLSLFLLSPGGSTTGIVLIVIGSGVWLGVQQLGYLEFGELRRLAQRTVEQRKTFANDLAIRHTIEELKKVRNYNEFCRVVIAGFKDNDFDGFDLVLHGLSGLRHKGDRTEIAHTVLGHTRLQWRKPGSKPMDECARGWHLNLDLVKDEHARASMTLYRLYSERPLQIDVNLLTSEFSTALADALNCTLLESLGASPDYSLESGTLAEAS
jgi:UDP-GlcNAc:undecaprenyl-phosphate GlcNAc-1-phosphate transferase